MELFNNLSAEEKQQLHDAIAQITVLVAGADGNIDPKEIAAAEKVTQVRSFSYHDVLKPYYEKVGENYTEKLNGLIETLPQDRDERQQQLGAELSKLNPILEKLDRHIGHLMYNTFISFAKHVAKASGGVIGMFSIGAEEKKVVELPMINAIDE